MKANYEWKDYEILATGDGLKLERWKDVYLLRPDPQVIWQSSMDMQNYPKLNAKYNRIGGGGAWQNLKPMPAQWTISWRDLNFQIKPMGFKHTGLFPEQAVNWAKMIDLISKANRPIKVLNLFAYTGGATVACTSAGAVVTHVDSAKNMVEVAKQNMRLSNLAEKPVRYIVDDCKKFVQREIKRGNKYDAIIMDPPSYGRGPTGEVWKIEEGLYDLVSLCSQVLSDNPLFFLINSYTTGLQPTVMKNIISRAVGVKNLDKIDAYEVCLPTNEKILLPCGCSAICEF
ncbi:MAG: class I SAM-dependent methyltransferase [Clostridia bacterium]|nr:class I SAM-dependent methyltransferase [Clostridia bacterium]